MWGDSIVYLKGSESQQYLSQLKLLQTDQQLTAIKQQFEEEISYLQPNIPHDRSQKQKDIFNFWIFFPFFGELCFLMRKYKISKLPSLIFILSFIIFGIILMCLTKISMIILIVSLCLIFKPIKVNSINAFAITEYLTLLQKTKYTLLNSKQTNQFDKQTVISTVQLFEEMQLQNCPNLDQYKDENPHNLVKDLRKLQLISMYIKDLVEKNKIIIPNFFNKQQRSHNLFQIPRILKKLFDIKICMKNILQYSIVECICQKLIRRIDSSHIVIANENNKEVRKDKLNNITEKYHIFHKVLFFIIYQKQIKYNENIQMLPYINLLKLQISMKLRGLTTSLQNIKKNNSDYNLQPLSNNIQEHITEERAQTQQIQIRSRGLFCQILTSDGAVEHKQDKQIEQNVSNLKLKLNRLIEQKLQRMKEEQNKLKTKQNIKIEHFNCNLEHKQRRVEGFGKIFLPKIIFPQNCYLE